MKKDLSYSYDILKGILANYRSFRSDKTESIVYHFDCPEFEELKEKYHLEKIAGKGDCYTKAKRLLVHFSANMAHDSMYDNHVERNALALLEYCYKKPEHGINCLNKAKIFTECCLALGIPARRLSIMPFSPFDTDNHVVSEVYDDHLEKWIMMDPTSGGLFVNEEGTPLSMLEIREHFADNRFITFVKANGRNKDLKKVEKRQLVNNWYICKNAFYFICQKHQEFGVRENDALYFIPEGYSVKENTLTNLDFRIDRFSDRYPEMIPVFEENRKKMHEMKEPDGVDISALLKSV